MSQADQFAELCDALRGVGMTIPDEVASYSDLVIAIKANPPLGSGSGGGGGNDPDGDFDDDPPPAMNLSTLGGRPRRGPAVDFMCAGLPNRKPTP